MNTPSRRIPVSRRFHITVALGAMIAVAACAPARRPVVWDAREITDLRPVSVRFDNDATDAVDVYLVSERREWRLGRVVAGGSAKLPIPEEAIVDAAGFVRLAVIEGGPLSARAAIDPRARFSIPQPIGDLPRQRFAFWDRQGREPRLIATR